MAFAWSELGLSGWLETKSQLPPVPRRTPTRLDEHEKRCFWAYFELSELNLQNFTGQAWGESGRWVLIKDHSPPLLKE